MPKYIITNVKRKVNQGSGIDYFTNFIDIISTAFKT